MSSSATPQSWVIAQLGDIAIWGSGGTPSRKKSEYYGGKIPWIKTGDLGPKVVVAASEFITEAAVQNSSAKFFSKGSVAIAMYGATIGKTSILGLDATTNQACAVGQPIPHVTTTDFLYYLLRSEKDNFIAKGKGGAQPNISQALIKEHGVLFPPLAEQKEIAARLDNLLAQVDSIKNRLDSIPTILKRFRQSVLAAAVSGRLTEGWRGANDAKGWEPAKVDDLVKVINGKAFPSKEYQESGVRLLRPGNLHVSGKVIWTEKNTTYIPIDWIEKRPELILQQGALLMNLTAQSLKDEFLGRVCIIEDADKVLLNQRICSFESKLTYDIKPYLYIFFKSPIFREYVSTLDSGSLIKHLNVKDIKSHVIDIPSQAEQTEIVRRVEQLLTFADQIEQRVKDAQSRVNNLTQSILAKAFSGELTANWREQNPDLISGVNSAEALLEKIKFEREVIESTKKAVKRKKAKV